MSAAAIINATAPNAEVAMSIARLLVEQRLAACVQMAPITSVYTWKGVIETDPEVLLIIKTRAALFEAVSAAVKTAHPYETPELIMTTAAAIDAEYAAWLHASTQD